MKHGGKKNRSRKKFSHYFLIAAVIVLGVMLGTIGVGYAYITGMFDKSPQNIAQSQEGTGNNSTVIPAEKLAKRVSFLLIGTDQRPEDPGFNTDSIILASVAPDTGIVSLMSIPRDSQVLNGLKINAVPVIYGIDRLMTLVTEITGVKLDGYVMTNFDGFKDIIDTLGGIDIYVEKRMKVETGDKVDGYIDLEVGEQRLDGSKALQYARFRSDALGDISRAARQQKVIMAIAREALKTETLTKLPQLIPQINKVVETNLGLSEMLKLAQTAANFSSENMVSTTLPGYFLDDAQGISFWKIDYDKAKLVTSNLLMGISTNRVLLGSIDERPPKPEQGSGENGQDGEDMFQSGDGTPFDREGRDPADGEDWPEDFGPDRETAQSGDSDWDDGLEPTGSTGG